MIFGAPETRLEIKEQGYPHRAEHHVRVCVGVFSGVVFGPHTNSNKVYLILFSNMRPD